MTLSSQFCNTYFQSNETTSDTPAGECHECLIRTVQEKLNSPFDYDSALEAEYRSFTSSCSITGFPYTTPAPIGSTTTTADSSAPTGCEGAMYNIRAGDTMNSVALAQNMSTEYLLVRNALSYNETGFPTTGQLCIQNKCAVHVVKASDDCYNLVRTYGINFAQLRAWNPRINGLCK